VNHARQYIDLIACDAGSYNAAINAVGASTAGEQSWIK
jgi:hypothetical protein